MTTTPGALCLTSAPTRVAELLLPTVISLLVRGPASASAFSALLHTHPEPPAVPSPGTRVTASRDHRPATPRPTQGERRANS